MSVCCLVRNSSGELVGMPPGGPSKICSWHLRMGMYCGYILRGNIGGRKSECSTRICLASPLRMGTESKERYSRWSATELVMRMGNWTWRNGGRGEDLGHFLPWSELLVGSQGVPVEVVGGDKAMGPEKEVWRWSTVWSTEARGLGRLPQVFFCRAGGWDWGIGSGEEEGEVRIFSLLILLLVR